MTLPLKGTLGGLMIALLLLHGGILESLTEVLVKTVENFTSKLSLTDTVWKKDTSYAKLKVLSFLSIYPGGGATRVHLGWDV